ncbi:MAG: UDP-N-acetylmuramate dehydrogenase [Bacteroidales bacterium]
MLLQEQYPLLKCNTFHIQAVARWFAEYSSVAELKELLRSDLLKTNPFLAIGGGSNILFTDNYPGVILHSVIRFIEPVREDENSVWIKVGSGVVWDDFCAYAVNNGLGGAENLSYIPGEVGASAVQNIGAYGVEACDIIEEVETIQVEQCEERIFKKEDCGYGYRKSIFKGDLKGKYIVTAVVFKLDKQPVCKLDYGNLREEVAKYPDLTPAAVRNAVIQIRKSKLPEPDVTGNAGSFFMNPVISLAQYTELLKEYPQMPHYAVSQDLVKIPAAWMIERCGWKGKEWGGAAVHDKQCLVLINKNQATASEICALADAICKSVKEKFDITISPEVNYI